MSEEKKELEYTGKMESYMSNDAGTCAGSHDIMAGIMALFGKLENNDMIIVEFEGTIKFRERNADEGRRVDWETLNSGTEDVTIQVNTTDLERMSRWKDLTYHERVLYLMLDEYQKTDEWMTFEQWKEFCQKFARLYRDAYEVNPELKENFQEIDCEGYCPHGYINEICSMTGIPFRSRVVHANNTYRINYLQDI